MYSLILHGRRLQKCMRNLSVSVNPLQNSSPFSTASAAAAHVSSQDGRKGKTFTVSYLVDSLGFTTKLAESISRKVSSEGKKGNPDSVLSLLRSYGFTDSHISDIIRIYPSLLVADAEKSLAPKLRFLQSRGASTSELTEVLSKVPKILGKKGVQTVSIYYDLVKEIVKADKSSKLERLCLSLPEGSRQENKLRNVLALRELGVPQRFLFSLLTSDGRPVCGKERFEESLKKVVGMGFDPTTPKFVQALNAVYQSSDKTTEEKVNVFCTRLGFSVKDVWAMFRKCPKFLSYSEKNILNSIDKILGIGFSRDEFVMMLKRFPQCTGLSAESLKRKTEFLVKDMNWPLKAVALYPSVLGCSLEKRIVPRCNFIKALISKGLLDTELPALGSVLICSDKVFLKRYLRKHDDKELVAQLMAIFTGDRAS